LKDGKPFLAIGTPGGDSQDQQILLVLLNVIDFGMGPAVGDRGAGGVNLAAPGELVRQSSRASRACSRPKRVCRPPSSTH